MTTRQNCIFSGTDDFFYDGIPKNFLNISHKPAKLEVLESIMFIK